MSESINEIISLFEGKTRKHIAKLDKDVQSMDIPSGFWDLWKKNKSELKKKGISVSKYNGVWSLNLWSKPTKEKIKKQIKKNPISIKLKDNIKNKLLKHQIEHTSKIAGIIKENRTALDASDTGTGKTYASLAAAKQLGLEPIIISPNSVTSAWNTALDHFGMKGTVVNWALIRTGKIREKGSSKSVQAKFITKNSSKNNDTVFKWNLKDNQILIFDEVHRAKNKGTLNQQLVIAAANDNVKTLGLSATVAENPIKFRAIGRLLKLFSGKYGFYDWAKQYGCENVKVTSRIRAFQFTGDETDLNKLHKDIFGFNAERMRIKDIKEFPETLITPKTYNMSKNTAKINRSYNKLEKLIKDLKEKGEKSVNILEQTQKMRQEIELLKIPSFIEMGNDFVESGNSVTIFVNYKETANQLFEKLNKNGEAVLFTGDIKKEQREINRKEFQSDKKRIFIATIPAGKEGIDLHDITGKYPRVSLISPSYSAQDLKQVFGRVQRAGGKSSSIQNIVFAADTIEEKVALRVAEKLKNIESFNDGDLANFTLEKELIENAPKIECDIKCKAEIKKIKKQMGKWGDWDKILGETVSKFKKAGVVRSKRSISMDKRITAKTVYSAPTKAWRKAPNQSDVAGIDTRDEIVKNERKKYEYERKLKSGKIIIVNKGAGKKPTKSTIKKSPTSKFTPEKSKDFNKINLIAKKKIEKAKASLESKIAGKKEIAKKELKRLKVIKEDKDLNKAFKESKVKEEKRLSAKPRSVNNTFAYTNRAFAEENFSGNTKKAIESLNKWFDTQIGNKFTAEIDRLSKFDVKTADQLKEDFKRIDKQKSNIIKDMNRADDVSTVQFDINKLAKDIKSAAAGIKFTQREFKSKSTSKKPATSKKPIAKPALKQKFVPPTQRKSTFNTPPEARALSQKYKKGLLGLKTLSESFGEGFKQTDQYKALLDQVKGFQRESKKLTVAYQKKEGIGKFADIKTNIGGKRGRPKKVGETVKDKEKREAAERKAVKESEMATKKAKKSIKKEEIKSKRTRKEIVKEVADLTTKILGAQKSGNKAEESFLRAKRIKLRQEAKGIPKETKEKFKGEKMFKKVAKEKELIKQGLAAKPKPKKKKQSKIDEKND